jgi:integrase
MIKCEPKVRAKLPTVHDWPKALREHWLRVVESSDDLFGAAGRAARWSPSTRLAVEKALSKLLSTLHPDEIRTTSSVPDLVTKPNLRRLAYQMRDANLTLNTQGTHITGIWLAACAITPDTDWTWIKLAAQSLRCRAKELVAGSASIPTTTDVLLERAKALFWQAWEDGARARVCAAIRARDSLIMGCLALRPLRRSNLAGLRLGVHLSREDGQSRITIPANEMKMGKRSYAAGWPEALAAEMAAYLEHIRPLLVRQRCAAAVGIPANDALWVSKFGTALSDVAIYRQISSLTAAEFGQPITLHRFRTIAATTLADFCPQDVRLATQVLGHSDDRSRDYYIRASGLIAARRSHECEDRLLREPHGRRRRECN